MSPSNSLSSAYNSIVGSYNRFKKSVGLDEYDSSIKKVKNLNEARELSKKNNSPVLAVATLNKLRFLQESTDPILNNISNDYNGNLSVVKVEIDNLFDFEVQRHDMHVAPTCMIFNNGTQIGNDIDDFQSKEDLEGKINKTLNITPNNKI